MHGSEASLERVVLKPGILQNDGSEAMPHAERMVLKLLQNGWYRSISLFHLDSCTPLVSDPSQMDSHRPVVQKLILMQVLSLARLSVLTLVHRNAVLPTIRLQIHSTRVHGTIA